MTENARVGIEFDRDGAVRSFEQALDEMQRRVVELELASERVDFDNASASAQRLRDNVREAADAVVSMAQRATTGLELTETQADQLAEAMETTKRRADSLGDSTGAADLRAQLDLTRSSADRLNMSLRGAQAAGQTGTGAAAGAAGAGAIGRFARIGTLLSGIARIAGPAGLAISTFLAAFKGTRKVLDDLRDLTGGLIDINGWMQRVYTTGLELVGVFDDNALSAKDLETQWRFLQERGIEVERTVEGINRGFDELQERQDRAATEAKRYTDFLGDLVEAQGKASPKGLSMEMEELALAYREAKERGDDWINGPLGDSFRDRVAAAQDAIRQFDEEIRASLSGEDLERYEKWRGEILNLDAAVQKQAESQQKVAQHQERIRETGDELASDVLPRLTEETDKNAEASERAAQAAKLYAEAQREQVAAAQEQAGAANTEVERLERQKTEIEQVVALGEAQGATMEQIAAASQVRGELFQIERELEQATKDQTQAAHDLARANDDASISFEERLQIARDTYGAEIDALGNVASVNDLVRRSSEDAARSSEQQGRAAQQLARDGAIGADALGTMADESQRFADGTADFERGTRRRGDAVEGLATTSEEMVQSLERADELLESLHSRAGQLREEMAGVNEELTITGELIAEIVSKQGQIADLGGADA